MPNTGLPSNLQALLDTLCGGNIVKSWQIYDDFGNVTVKIRFCNGGHVGDNGQSTVTSNSYMRKPKSKMERDQKRAATFMEHKHDKRVTRSQTRKEQLCVQEDTEKPRIISDSSGEPLLDSPVLVDPDMDMPSQASDSLLISPPSMYQPQLCNSTSEVCHNQNIMQSPDPPMYDHAHHMDYVSQSLPEASCGMQDNPDSSQSLSDEEQDDDQVSSDDESSSNACVDNPDRSSQKDNSTMSSETLMKHLLAIDKRLDVGISNLSNAIHGT